MMTDNKIILVQALRTLYFLKRSEYRKAKANVYELDKELSQLEIEINDLTDNGFLKINDIPKEIK